MNRIRLTLYAVLLYVLFAPAFAQATDVIYNLPLWGQSILTFALALTLFTQAIKIRLKKAVPNLPAAVVQLGTLGVGIGVAFWIYSQNLLLDPFFASLPAPFNWLSYGGLAGVGAMGGYDLLMSIAKALGGKTVGGKVITVPDETPTAAEAEKQIDSVPGITASFLRNYALSRGIPAFIVDAVLALNPLEHAVALLNEIIARKRKLTPEEIAADQLAWAKDNPVTEEELEAARTRLQQRQGARR